MNNKRKIEFAVIGWTSQKDIGKGVYEKRLGTSGLLSWHESVQDAWVACYKINISGGFASVKKMPNGQMTEETIKMLVETL